MLSLLLVCLLATPLLTLAQDCPPRIDGCRCYKNRENGGNNWRIIVRCDGFSGSAIDFKNNLQSLNNYTIDELIINNYRTSRLPEEPFTNIILRKITITNSYNLRYFWSTSSSKSFFENIGNSLESLSLLNTENIDHGEWKRITISLDSGSGEQPTVSTTVSTSGTDSPTPSTEKDNTTPEDGSTPSTNDTPSEDISSTITPNETPVTEDGSSTTNNDTSVTADEGSTPANDNSTDESSTQESEAKPTNEASSDGTTPLDEDSTSDESTSTGDETTSSEDSTGSNDTSTETDTPTTDSSSSSATVQSTSSNTLPFRKIFQMSRELFGGRALLSVEGFPNQIKTRANSPALKELIFQNNQDSSFDDLSVFSSMVSIERVIMNRISLSGAFRTDLSVFPSLKTLDLSQNSLLFFNPTKIPDSLQTLDLSNNMIQIFDQGFLQTLTQPQYQSLHINVKSNNLNCQCDYVKIIVDQLQGMFEGTCAAPPSMKGKPLGKGGCVQTYSFLPYNYLLDRL